MIRLTLKPLMMIEHKAHNFFLFCQFLGTYLCSSAGVRVFVNIEFVHPFDLFRIRKQHKPTIQVLDLLPFTVRTITRQKDQIDCFCIAAMRTNSYAP